MSQGRASLGSVLCRGAVDGTGNLSPCVLGELTTMNFTGDSLWFVKRCACPAVIVRPSPAARGISASSKQRTAAPSNT